MIVTIQIDTESPLSNAELDLLHTLTGLDVATDDEPKPAKKAAKKAPAKKAAEPAPEPEPESTDDDDEPAPAKKAAKKAPAKKRVAEPAPEPEPESDDDDAEETAEKQRSEAIALASSLLASGQREKVMAALSDAGAARVSEVSVTAIPDFLQALRSE